MVNYYFKYLELLDTVFLAFKKKPLRELSPFSESPKFLIVFTPGPRVLACLPSLCHCPSLLLSTQWQDFHRELSFFFFLFDVPDAYDTCSLGL